jgi:hypothetical protein
MAFGGTGVVDYCSSFKNELGHLADDPLSNLINYNSDQGSFHKLQSKPSILLVSEHTRQKEAFGGAG